MRNYYPPKPLTPCLLLPLAHLRTRWGDPRLTRHWPRLAPLPPSRLETSSDAHGAPPERRSDFQRPPLEACFRRIIFPPPPPRRFRLPGPRRAFHAWTQWLRSSRSSCVMSVRCHCERPAWQIRIHLTGVHRRRGEWIHCGTQIEFSWRRMGEKWRRFEPWRRSRGAHRRLGGNWIHYARRARRLLRWDVKRRRQKGKAGARHRACL
mmetsp:Transcript_26522/g.48704  ORF Transcript_26522/g.48704 Transcript_26522/m.48704 type:complete len:207 (-) Transcript_26522:437-1057(-)